MIFVWLNCWLLPFIGNIGIPAKTTNVLLNDDQIFPLCITIYIE